MDWENRAKSKNVEDRRSFGKTAAVGAGGVGLIVIILGLLLGVDPRTLMGPQGPGQAVPRAGQGGGKVADPEEERMADFTKVIFRDTEDVWDDLFRQMGKEYRKPTLVLYTDQVRSGCGVASAAVGPFYCPADEKVYVDLSFYRDMARDFKIPGEFSRAYVVAHEVGHHVQRQLGYAQRVEEARGTRLQNQMSVRLELQADFLAGVWGHHGQKKFRFLETGDLESAIKAAFEIGDDRLQRRSQGFVVPHSFTHGTSAQRMRWFQEGFKTGDVRRAQMLFELDYDRL